METPDISDDDIIIVERDPGWPIVVRQEWIFSDLTDAEFRVMCGYLALDKANSDHFENLIENYPPDEVANLIRWIREQGITRNG